MTYQTERNEQITRTTAKIFTVLLHAAFFAWLYFAASEKPAAKNEISTTATTKTGTPAKPAARPIP